MCFVGDSNRNQRGSKEVLEAPGLGGVKLRPGTRAGGAVAALGWGHSVRLCTSTTMLTPKSSKDRIPRQMSSLHTHYSLSISGSGGDGSSDGRAL